tara:strand:- start:806 stop:1066 length:261 start_codon:yes stop_codon:yes gene_type:complete
MTINSIDPSILHLIKSHQQATKYEAEPTLDILASNGFNTDSIEHGISVNAALNAHELGEFVTDRDVFYVISAGSFNPNNEAQDLPF